MTILKKDLQALNKDIKALSNKIDMLLAAAGKSEKTKEARKTKTNPARLKTTKKAPAKKAPAKKRPAKLAATDHVLKILRGRKRGVDTATIMAKTGLNQKQVWNIIHRAYKTGKIKRVGKGLYVAA
jgi:hypothetical protein